MNIISGDKFAALNGIGNVVFKSMDELWGIKNMYLKNKEYLNDFPKTPFVLVTHQGDVSITHDHDFVLSIPNLIHWYATNVQIKHDKLTCIPVGIEYRLTKENEAIFKEVMAMDIPKTKDISTDCFAVHTWVEERQRCLDAMNRNGLIMEKRKPYKEYLMSLKASRFCLCPIGNGIDTFRFWECLYLGCVPIICNFINNSPVKIKLPHYFMDLPIEIINDWEDFNIPVPYNEQLCYDGMQYLNFDYWKQLILSHD